jgi:ribonucleoside-triphosphate reductase
MISNNETPWSSVGYLTYKRTYARPLEEGRTEEWSETIERIVKASKEQLHVGFTPDEEDRLRHYMRRLKATVAGRFLWQLGTGTVDRLGLPSLQNCAFTVVDHPIRPFCWAMDMLALGSGVGYNIQRKHIDKLPSVKPWFTTPTRVEDAGADFIIPDSREGWVKFLGKTLKAAFLSDSPEKGTFTYWTGAVRGKGTPIKSFGGVASGPEDLVWGIGEIGKILVRRAGKQIRSVDALDIMNIIGAIIVAGNVRRSAQIAIGDPDDVEYLLAKRWDLGNIPHWRQFSNNSVACSDIGELHELFWAGYEGKGEPYGLINLELSRLVGRLGDYDYPDARVEGYNPCAEQSLEDKETCCLATLFLPNFESQAELLDAATLLYRINKHSLKLPCHNKDTEEVVHRNMRMGISITGYLEATEEQKSWLDETYIYLRQYDESYSRIKGWPISIKLTTVQPSGTLSLLPGVRPGCHPSPSGEYMIRRITIAAEHTLVDVCREHGYPIEYKLNIDGTQDYGSCVVEFPFKYKSLSGNEDYPSAVEQLQVVKRLQTEWSDNSVSCTIYYTPEEIPEIKEYLKENYRSCHKSLSFLLKSEHGFKQAPYEEISKDEYERFVQGTRLIVSVDSAEFDGADDCSSGACPVR